MTDEERKGATSRILVNCRMSKPLIFVARKDCPALGTTHAYLIHLYEVSFDATCQAATESPHCLGVPSGTGHASPPKSSGVPPQ